MYFDGTRLLWMVYRSGSNLITIYMRFHQLYMDIAFRLSQMSYANKLKVGCVIVKDKRIISMSWNGTPSGTDNTCEYEFNGNLVTKDAVIHAEENAILKLARDGQSGLDSVLYCTHSPCIDCAKMIYSIGIKQVYYKDDYRSVDGIDFLRELKVGVDKL